MPNIKKEYKNGYIVYSVTDSTVETLEELRLMLKNDIKETYMFVFDFKSLDFLSVDAIKMLEKIYIMSINHACEIGIIGLNKQPAMMFEIFQLDRLYSVKKASNIFHGERNESLYSA